MPILCSSAPMENPGKVSFDQECGELFAVDLGEDGEQVGKAGVGDPHFFAVQNVMLAIGESSARVRQLSASDPDEDSDNA